MEDQKEAVRELPPEAMGLVAQLVQRNYDSYAATTQQLLEGLQDENAKLRAERDLIREGVEHAIDGSYMPTSALLLRLLYPSREEIAQRVEEERKVSG